MSTADSPRMTIAIAGRLARQAGLGAVETIAQLRGGRNNRVYRVELVGPHEPVLLKMYFRSPDDLRDRLSHEYGFSQFAWSTGLRCIPEPIAHDQVSGAALYQYVAGQMLPPGGVEADHVLQAMMFFSQLNTQRDSEDAGDLPVASEACFSNAAHARLILQRVAKLEGIEDEEAAAFVRDEVQPVAEAFADRYEGDDVSAPRCLSPSDFGFHNAIQPEDDGPLVFHDFEYAGWDDPAKLVGDFFHQPRRPAPMDMLDVFVGGVTDALQLTDEQRQRCLDLLPLFGLKWACIVLNPLLPTGKQRRGFAGVTDDTPRLIARARSVLHRAYGG